jgi:tetratricopeptide (TPR) repeat protein
MLKKLSRNFGKLLSSLIIACAFGYGFYGLFTYALPLSKDNFAQARTSLVADETEVLLNGAAKAYEEGRLDEATRVLEIALEKLVDKSGRYDLADRSKLARVYFLLGKSYHLQEKYDRAIANYEDTLRIDPGHMAAKYNLEMIQMMGGQGGNGGRKPGGGMQPKI